MRLNEFLRRILWLPEQASTVAKEIDTLHFWVIGVTMIASLGCGAVAWYCIFRFQRRHEGDGEAAAPFVRPPHWFEPVVVGGPLAIFLAWWVIGFHQFIGLDT